MISILDRRQAVELIEEAVAASARCAPACEAMAISIRTYQRWTRKGPVRTDGRPQAKRPQPKSKLSEEERAQLLAICHRAEFASLPPSQIAPMLTDKGRFLASEATICRLLREADVLHHRGRAQAPRPPAPKPTHRAVAPCQVWSWDITWLKSPKSGILYYPYPIIDLYSRRIVGWEVHAHESAYRAAALVRRAVLAEGCVDKPLVLHAGNGGPQKGSTLRAMLEALGIGPSYSRPPVSDDNANAESVFLRTIKPPGRTTRHRALRTWKQCGSGCCSSRAGYIQEHRHSGIHYVTAAQRHEGQDEAMLRAREQVYTEAKAGSPNRWSGPARDWTPVGDVWLNP